MRAPRPGSLVAAACAAGCALALAACGSGGGDLLAVDRSGDVPGANLRVVIEDVGLVHCNDGKGLRMPDQLLLDARELQRQLNDPKMVGARLEARPGSILRYDAHTVDGSVRFADNSIGPPAFNELALLVRRIAQDVCGLPR